MNQDQWTAVDSYLTNLFVPADPVLDATLQHTSEAGMPPINVAPNQGKLLHLLARLHGARTILEIGTLAGYSTIWLARALPPEGRMISLEFDPMHAAVARQNLEHAGLSAIVDVRVGRALGTLPQLANEQHGPFDLVFIDADKVSTPEYLDWALRLTHLGSLIIIDNVVRNGAVTDANSDDPNIQGMRTALDALAHDSRLAATAIQTVGGKGYDGFAIALVTGT